VRDLSRYRPPATGAFAEMLAADAEREEDRPFGGWAGERAVPRSEPGPPAPSRPSIPPPDWEAEAAEAEADPPEEEPR
jgi:hypothetical protein